jgi:hypothetical protein
VHEHLELDVGRVADGAMSSRESSRARITREAPSSRASSTEPASVQVICVEAWIGSSGATARDEARDAEVLHDDGVDAGAAQARAAASTASSSWSNTRVLSVT